MIKKIDLVFLVAGAFGCATILEMASEHIDRTEESKGLRLLKKAGLCASAFAIGGFMADITTTSNIVMELHKSKL